VLAPALEHPRKLGTYEGEERPRLFTKKSRTYSKGNRQKVALVAALAADVELLILDEPTAGLDPLMEAVFQECIAELHAAGRTVLLSSHILAEVEALCHRVSINRAGRTVESGTLTDLRHLTRTSIVVETVESPGGLADLDGVHDLHLDGRQARFNVDTNQLDAALLHLTRLGVRSLTSRPPTLEELFLRRRDRVVLPICVVVAAGFVILTAASFQGLYPTAAERADFAATIEDNSTFAVLYGPAQALDSIGGLTAWRIGSTVAVVVALMSLLLIGRHTRAEEEHGRAELLRAGAIGRLAPLAAALAVVAATDLTIAVVVALGLIALGLPAAGSLALGASLGATGLVFAGVGAVAAQLTDGARSAYGISGAALAVAYLLRAAGDAGDGTLSWLSPIGWAKATRPFDDERWWALLLCVAAFALLVAAACALLARRDLGAGLIASRPGPPVAGRDLRSTLGLAFRLQRGSLLAWSTGLFLAGWCSALSGRTPRI